MHVMFHVFIFKLEAWLSKHVIVEFVDYAYMASKSMNEIFMANWLSVFFIIKEQYAYVFFHKYVWTLISALAWLECSYMSGRSPILSQFQKPRSYISS